jgi:hypothetical protein
MTLTHPKYLLKIIKIDITSGGVVTFVQYCISPKILFILGVPALRSIAGVNAFNSNQLKCMNENKSILQTIIDLAKTSSYSRSGKKHQIFQILFYSFFF